MHRKPSSRCRGNRSNETDTSSVARGNVRNRTGFLVSRSSLSWSILSRRGYLMIFPAPPPKDPQRKFTLLGHTTCGKRQPRSCTLWYYPSLESAVRQVTETTLQKEYSKPLLLLFFSGTAIARCVAWAYNSGPSENKLSSLVQSRK